MPFFLSLLVFTGLLFTIRALKMFDLVISKNAALSEIVLLFSFIIPKFFEIALPMSTLLAVLVAFGNLSAASEIVVIRSCGLSLKKLAIPVVLFSLVVFSISLLMSLFITPYANHRLGIGLFRLAKEQAQSSLVPGVFNSFGDLTIYAEKISKNGEKLDNLIISDRRSQDLPKTSIAKTGQLRTSETNRNVSIKLYDGSIYEGRNDKYNFTTFDIENVNLSENSLYNSESIRDGKFASELGMKELAVIIKSLESNEQNLSSKEKKELLRFRVEWHRRFVLPASCLIVSLVAMCLGIQPSRSEFAWGSTLTMIVGVLTIVLYYLLFALATALSKQGIAPPLILMWIPNFLFLLLAVYLMKKVGSEKWLSTGQAFANLLDKSKSLKSKILNSLFRANVKNT